MIYLDRNHVNPVPANLICRYDIVVSPLDLIHKGSYVVAYLFWTIYIINKLSPWLTDMTDWLSDSVRIKLENYKCYQLAFLTHYSSDSVFPKTQIFFVTLGQRSSLP